MFIRTCLGARLLPQSYQYPNLSEGADRVGGQLRGDKECPFSGVTKSGRVWRKVPESDARSVCDDRSSRGGVCSGLATSFPVAAFTKHHLSQFPFPFNFICFSLETWI